MKDFSVDNWFEYIKSHKNEFNIEITGPDKYNLWRVDITSKQNSHYSDNFEDTDKDVALDRAIGRLASILYQYYKTPENLSEGS